jgi:hypothetical protein
MLLLETYRFLWQLFRTLQENCDTHMEKVPTHTFKFDPFLVCVCYCVGYPSRMQIVVVGELDMRERDFFQTWSHSIPSMVRTPTETEKGPF